MPEDTHRLMDEILNKQGLKDIIEAARRRYDDTGVKLFDAAKAASAANAGVVDQFVFRRMLAMHAAVQKEFMGIRAEAGRALQAWRIPVGLSRRENLAALRDVLDNFGGALA
jgi:hypothetical protein